MDNTQVAIPVAFFFDYICPFCYIGSVRLLRLGERFPLQIRWRFVEIHPDNPSKGRPLSELGYPPAQWRQMQENIEQMTREDGIPMAPRSFTTNSRRALLLAQAVLDRRPQRFPALHQAIFDAYFVDGRNIGDPEVLADLARQHEVDDLLDAAWHGPEFFGKLLKHVEAAQALQLNGVPALKVGNRVFSGAVSVQTLAQALEQAAASPAQ
jgi:predicted DsbA family dithiol-disulfide isomerase